MKKLANETTALLSGRRIESHARSAGRNFGETPVTALPRTSSRHLLSVIPSPATPVTIGHSGDRFGSLAMRRFDGTPQQTPGSQRLWHGPAMTSYFAQMVNFVGAHPQLSFVPVFLLALSEAVPVIGTMVPGSTLILAISALATTAGITPWALLGAAVAGAIVGDGFSFWLGHRFHRQT